MEGAISCPPWGIPVRHYTSLEEQQAHCCGSMMMSTVLHLCLDTHNCCSIILVKPMNSFRRLSKGKQEKLQRRRDVLFKLQRIRNLPTKEGRNRHSSHEGWNMFCDKLHVSIFLRTIFLIWMRIRKLPLPPSRGPSECHRTYWRQKCFENCKVLYTSLYNIQWPA